jgi:hypothetical protein
MPPRPISQFNLYGPNCVGMGINLLGWSRPLRADCAAPVAHIGQSRTCPPVNKPLPDVSES